MMDNMLPEKYMQEQPISPFEANAAPNQPLEMPMMNPMMNPMSYQPSMFPNPPCPCIPQEMVITNVKLARAYVPFQKFCTTFSPIEGLRKGTIFPELYSPYKGEDKTCKPQKYD